MVTIGMDYKVIPGKEPVFERAVESVLEAMQSMSGHSETFLYKDVKQSNFYLIVSKWNDKKDFDDFVASEAFARVTQWGKENILLSRPVHTVYNN